MPNNTTQTPPSLSYHRRLNALHKEKKAAVGAVPQYEVKEVGLPKVNKDGELILQNGMPIVSEQRVLVRDIVASEWDDAIKAFEDAYEGHKGDCPACIVA